MISDVVRLILEEKDDSRKYIYENLCLRWQKEKIVVSAKENEKYMVRRFNPKNYISIGHISELIERKYCIPLCFGFRF